MSAFVEFMFIFFIGALGGWIIELFFRRFVSQKHWVNPGFLKGPYLPLYGFGVLGLYIICRLDLSFLNVSLNWQTAIKLIIIPFVMTFIEYIAGIIFIKGMKIKLWDYSNRWGNIQGIICPVFSLFWGIIGGIYFLFIDPLIANAVSWISKNLAFSFFIGAFFGILCVDFWISMNLATKIRKLATKENVVIHFESFKASLIERRKNLKQKVSFINPFVSNESLNVLFSDYLSRSRSKIKEIMVIDEKESDYLSIIGFVTSLFGLSIFSLLCCVVGYKTTKYKKLNIAGFIISSIEVIAVIVLLFVYIFCFK